MNITDLYTVDDHEAGAEMQVKSPSGKVTDFFICFVGRDSKAFRKLNHEHEKRVFGGGDEDESLAELMACAATDWRGLKDNKKAVKFSKAKVKQLMVNAPYIVEQANLFIGSRANFTKAKATN